MLYVVGINISKTRWSEENLIFEQDKATGHTAYVYMENEKRKKMKINFLLNYSF